MSSIEVDPLTAFVEVDVPGDTVEVEVIGQGEKGDAGGGAFDGDASDVPYTPATEGDWGTVPAQVAEALDELAGRESGTMDGTFQTVGIDTLYDGVNFDLSADEITGVTRTLVIVAGARTGTHVLPLRAVTEADAGLHWQIEYSCGGDGVTVLRVPDPLGQSPQYVDLAGLKVDGWIIDMVGVWDAEAEEGLWALHAIHDRRGDLVAGGGGGAVDSVNGQTGVVVLDAGDVGALDASSGYNTANGWLKLDGSGTAPDSTIPAWIARDTEVTSAVSAHAGATDPHGDRAAAAALVDDLSGVSDTAAARTNLGLGTAATKDTGTGSGNVILGNDSRLTDARTPTAHSHAPGDITGLDEQVRDVIGAALVAGSGVTVTVNDAGDTITIAATGSSLDEGQVVLLSQVFGG